MAIREIVDLPDFKNSVKWISRILTLRLPCKMLQILWICLKAWLNSEKEGRYQQSENILETDERVRSVKVAEYHRQMIQLGAESITRFQVMNGTFQERH